jgi:hypothetical protein
MKKQQTNPKELVLEVQKDGHRKLIYRTIAADGTPLFIEESNLVDFSRPFYEGDDFNVFFTDKAFWKSFLEYTSSDGFTNRQVWHQTTNEWLTLRPIFIHKDVQHLIQESIADVLRNLSTDQQSELEGVRSWLRALSGVETQNTNSFKTLRHAV